MSTGEYLRHAGIRIMFKHTPAAEQPVVVALGISEALFGLVALLQPAADAFDLRQRLRQVVGVDTATELAIAELPRRQAEARPHPAAYTQPVVGHVIVSEALGCAFQHQFQSPLRLPALGFAIGRAA